MHPDYRLTPKKSKLVQCFLKHGSHYLAGVEAGYNEKDCQVIHNTIFQQIPVKLAIATTEAAEFETDEDDFYLTSGLTPQLARLAVECSTEDNMRQAALNAGFNPDYIDDLCNEALKNPTFLTAVRDHTSAQIKRISLSKDAVLSELMGIAFSNITDYLSDDWRLKDKGEIPKELLKAVSDVEVKENKFGETSKIKMHSKINALQMLGQYLNMFKEDKSTGPDEGNSKEVSDVELLHQVLSLVDRSKRG